MPSPFWERIQDAYALVKDGRVKSSTTPDDVKVYEVPQLPGHPRLIRIDVKGEHSDDSSTSST